MSAGRKKLPLLEKVEITDIGARGKAIARVDNYVTFVSNALPGDVVDIQVQKRRKSYQEGRAVRFHRYSDQRTDSFCRHFGQCGGCRWQDLQYTAQLTYKQQEVKDNLRRIGKLDLPELDPILASDRQRYYRNKLEFTFSNRRWISREEVVSGHEIGDRNGLGFHMPGMFDRVIDIAECHLQESPSDTIRGEIREYARRNGLTFFDLREKGGLLRNLIIRNTTLGEVMILMVFYEEDEKAIRGLMSHLKKTFPNVTSLMYCINRKANDSLFDQEFTLFSGRDHIIEQLEGLRFRIGPKSFFQTNSLQALAMYRKVREFAALAAGDTVFDLYCGTGTIGIFLAGRAGKVVGIENIREAVGDARMNAGINRIDNASFFAGDTRELLSGKFYDREGRPDVIVTDPPRTGMHSDVVKSILCSEARRVVYVSCNPATQARDLGILCEKYRISRVQPVDMFPHTCHVENIVLLELPKEL